MDHTSESNKVKNKKLHFRNIVVQIYPNWKLLGDAYSSYNPQMIDHNPFPQGTLIPQLEDLTLLF